MSNSTLAILELDLIILAQIELIDNEQSKAVEAVSIGLLALQKLPQSKKRKFADALASAVANNELENKGFISSLNIPQSWTAFFNKEVEAILLEISK